MTDATPETVEEFPDVEEPKEGQPLVAVFFAVAAIIAGTIFSPIPPLEGTMARLVTVGVGTLVAAVLWGLAWLVTIRHSSTGWKLASFALMWVAAVGTLDRCIARSHAAMKNDVMAFESIKLDPNGSPMLPEKAEHAGPISRMLVDFFKASADDTRKTEGQIGALEFDALNNPYLTETTSGVLENCERAEKGKPLVRDFAKRQTKRAADLKAQAEAMWLPEAEKAELLKTVTRHGGATRLTELAEIQAKMFDEWRIRCTILARRNWKAGGYMFLFTNQADLAEMRPAAERHDRLRAEYNEVYRKALRESGAYHMGLQMP